MAATPQKVGRGQQKARNLVVPQKKQLKEHLAANWVNWQQIGNMTEH